MRNLAKSRPELVTAGYPAGAKYVPAISQNKETKAQTLRPTPKILEFFHSVTLPIVDLHVNWHHPTSKPNHSAFDEPPSKHPAPNIRITSEDAGAALWHPGNGRDHDEEGGTMVYTRWESRSGNLGLSPNAEIAAIHTNGGSSYAAIGRHSSTRASLFYSFRMGTGESITQLIANDTPGRTGIGLGVWIANLAGLGCVPGIGLQKGNTDDLEGDAPSESNYEQIPVPEASSLFTEYGLGLVMVTSDGEVHMFKAQTRPLAWNKPKTPMQIDVNHMAGWKLCPRTAISSLRVDDDYNAEKRIQGRPWCVVQNVLGEIWTFGGDPREREVYIPPDSPRRNSGISISTQPRMKLRMDH